MQYVLCRWRCVLVAGIALGALGSAPLRANPTIFHSTESASPGDLIGLQGASFGTSPVILIATVSATGTVGSTTTLTPQTASDIFVAATVPSTYGAGLWQIQVRDSSGNTSNAVLVNKARITSMEFPEIDPGRTFRIFGRNLTVPGGTRSVKFVDNANPTLSYSGTVSTGGDSYVVTIQAPSSGLTAGHTYAVHYGNGKGGSMGDAIAPGLLANPPSLVEQTPGLPVIAAGTDPFGLNVPWGTYFAAFDVPAQTSTVATGTGNDQLAIQNAIDYATTHGGGVVRIPAGTYHLNNPGGTSGGTFLTLKSNVVVQGDGQATTTLICALPAHLATGVTKSAMIAVAPGCSVIGLADLTVRCDNSNNFTTPSVAYPMFSTDYTSTENTSRLFVLRVTFDGAYWAPTGVTMKAKAPGTGTTGPGRFLLSDCTVENLRRDARPFTTKDFGNQDNTTSYVTVRNCHFPNFNICLVLGGYQALYEGNELVFDGDYYNHLVNSPTDPVSPGLGQTYADSGVQNRLSIAGPNVLVLTNTFSHAGAPFVNQNDGENILGEEHATNPDQGLASNTSTIHALVDSTKAWATDYTGYTVALVDGTGKGQQRTVASNTTTSLSVTQDWDVAPSSDSRYYVFRWNVPHVLIKDNTATDKEHVAVLYTGAYDAAIVHNSATNSADIRVRTMAGNPGGALDLTTAVLMDILIADNTLTATSADKASVITVETAYGKTHVGVQDTTARLGTGAFLIETRRNNVTSLGTEAYRAVDTLPDGPFYQWHPAGATAPLPMAGIIFDGNTVHSAATGYGWLPGITDWLVARSTETDVFRHAYDLTFRDGVLSGGATLAVDPLDPDLRTLSLDGTGSVELQTLTLPSTVTVEGRFRTSATNQSILGNRKYDGKVAIYINNSGQIDIWDGKFGSGSGNNVHTSTSYADGNWHQFAWVSSGTSETLYVDGLSPMTFTNVTRDASTGDGTISWDTSEIPFDGDLDEIRVWSTARTQDEVQAFQDTQLAGDEPGLLQYWRFSEGGGIIAKSGVLSGDLAPGLVGYWRCDDGSGSTSLTDSSSGGHAASLVGTTTWPDGWYGPAIQLSGTGNYATVADTPSLDMTTALTLHARIYVPSSSISTNPALDWLGILSKGDPSSTFAGWEFGTYAPTGTTPATAIGIYFRRASSVGQITCSGPATLVADQWHAVDATFDGSTGTSKVYVDGQLQATISNTRALPASTAPLYIGRRSVGGGSLFKGMLDDLKIYSRALSAQEIAELDAP